MTYLVEAMEAFEIELVCKKIATTRDRYERGTRRLKRRKMKMKMKKRRRLEKKIGCMQCTSRKAERKEGILT